jgi:hypothetical protein
LQIQGQPEKHHKALSHTQKKKSKKGRKEKRKENRKTFRDI